MLLRRFERFGQSGMLPFFFGQVAQQLANAGVGRLLDRPFVKLFGFEFHQRDLPLNHFHAKWTNEPHGPARDEPFDVVPPDERNMLAEFRAI